MTPQQAGVSAEALRGAITIALLFMRHTPECDGGQGDPVNGPKCACGMYQARQTVQATIDADWNSTRTLATAPPEQAAPSAEYWTQERLQSVAKNMACSGGDIQAASAGALEDSFAQIVKDLREAKASINGKPVMELWAANNWIADRIEAALAAHDQKVREPLAAWMIANSFATGHGDTVEDLLKELKWQIEERDQKVRADALEEAFNLRPYLANEGNSAQFREGYYAGLEAFRQAIKRAYDERPATEKKCS